MVNGIDVSKWQGKMNWDAAYKCGIRHAMLRAGIGAGQVDVQFARNVSECERIGIAWGAYWYSFATTEAAARAEARACLAALKGRKPSMPIAYDIEYEPDILALSNAQRTALVKAFLDEIEAAGYYGMLYASRDFIRNRLNWSELKKYDVWVAQYASTCTCPLPYGIWQYSSKNALGVLGYGQSLDCDRIYKDYPAIIKAAGLNGWPKQADKPAPAEPTDPTHQEIWLDHVTLPNAAAMEFYAVAAKYGLDNDKAYHAKYAEG